MKNNFMDYLHAVRATVTNSSRATNPANCEVLITHREIWTRATRAAARKATADGVNGIAVNEKNGDFYIFQISGYTPERGLYCDLLDRNGHTVKAF